MESTLYQIFKESYNRDSFEKNVLTPIFNKSVKDYIIYNKEGEQEVELTDTEKRTAKKVVKYGEFKTHDNRKIELYEVTVEDFRQVKIARVGLGALVKKLIIGNNAVFATFKYEDVTEKHWRFSFIAYDSFFEDGQVQTKETNPKRYTYVFGDKEETYRTAIDRFQELDSKFQIKVKDIQEAFAVEAMSKEFFDEYRETHYAKFVKYLTGEEFQKTGGKYELVKVQNPSPFLASVFNGDKKDARDFCKKLLGQIVFLYFIQKKGWLGATNTNYKEGNGDKNFIQNFYKQAGENDNFYPLWLSKLFYDTLNQKRDNDDFEMPDGSIVKIPYLNGGLFEKESDKFDHLIFPSELFTDLFEFFNRFNFTIYENSPEEHTVAVDPEMLGHIFENLLEDNKDKGAFYTPKEIVQYMTQETLIEYLVTHLGDNAKDGISLFVKQKNKEALTDIQLNEINTLLDKVKICDPAIGSGAFPMGMLQEIFALKERIAFDLGFKIWSPATVKENIIQNSIYGVDIEKGAVDIAQLRFWLSLVVDEEMPKALPNLAYKIVLGNSLVSKFEDEIVEIDWSTDDTKAGFFAQELINEKTELLISISNKQKQFFTADSLTKATLKKEIRDLKLDILSKQLDLMIETKGYHKQTGKKLSQKETEKWIETEGWKRTRNKVEQLKESDKPFNHFDWRLDFPEILNPIVNSNPGFDIVIGNPPWVSMKGKHGIEENKRNDLDTLQSLYNCSTYRPNLFEFFIVKSLTLQKKGGCFCFIVPDRLGYNASLDYLRDKILEEYTLREIVYKWDFETIIADTMTLLIKNEKQLDYDLLIKNRPLQDYIKINTQYIKLLNKRIFKSYETVRIKEIVENIILCGESLSPTYCSTATGFIGISSKLTEQKEINSQIEVLKGSSIKRYSVNEPLFYELIDENIKGGTKNKFKLNKKEKIFVRKTGSDIIAAYSDSSQVPEQSLYFLYDFIDVSPKYILGILNSNLINWFYNIQLVTNEDSTPQLKNYDLDSIPIVRTNFENKYSILVDYLLYLNKAFNKTIIGHTGNNRIASHIEDILDMMVYELYFENHMKEKGLDVLQFINPQSIKNLQDDYKIAEIIKDFYLWYQKPENEVRQRILLIETRSKDTLAVIRKSVN